MVKFLDRYKYALGYVLCVALVSVIREKLMLQVSPILILLLSSLLASCYFHALNFSNLQGLYKKLWQHKPLFFKLNIIVALMWLATYYSIYFSSASIFVFEYFLTGGFLSLLQRKDKDEVENIATIMFPLLLLSLFYIYPHFWFGILLGISGGSFGFLYNLLSKNLASELNLSASQTLASRFWLLIIILVVCVPKDAASEITAKVFITILIITLLSFILQIWLNQKSVITIGGRESSFIGSFTPALTFIVQGLVLHDWYFSVLFLSLISSVYIAYDLIRKEYALIKVK